MKPGKTGFTRIVYATGYSLKGLRATWVHEAAFRQNVMLSCVLFPLSFWLANSALQWLALITPLFLLLIVELINSAIENTVDRIGFEKHELSGRAKDAGSAAVMLCLLLIMLCWSAIIWQNHFQ